MRRVLVEAAHAAAHTKNTYLSAQYHRLAARLGKKKALIAVAHSILVISCYVLTREEDYQELGGNSFDAAIGKRWRNDWCVGWSNWATGSPWNQTALPLDPHTTLKCVWGSWQSCPRLFSEERSSHDTKRLKRIRLPLFFLRIVAYLLPYTL
jgi:hypothetical protein